jgi:hypothetical protein
MRCHTQYTSTHATTIIPASFNIATLFPLAAIRVSRVALPLSVLLKVEKVSLYDRISEANEVSRGGAGERLGGRCGWNGEFGRRNGKW